MGFVVRKNGEKFDIFSTYTDEYVSKGLTVEEMLVFCITERMRNTIEEVYSMLWRKQMDEGKYHIISEKMQNDNIREQLWDITESIAKDYLAKTQNLFFSPPKTEKQGK